MYTIPNYCYSELRPKCRNESTTGSPSRRLAPVRCVRVCACLPCVYCPIIWYSMADRRHERTHAHVRSLVVSCVVYASSRRQITSSRCNMQYICCACDMRTCLTLHNMCVRVCMVICNLLCQSQTSYLAQTRTQTDYPSHVCTSVHLTEHPPPPSPS